MLITFVGIAAASVVFTPDPVVFTPDPRLRWTGSYNTTDVLGRTRRAMLGYLTVPLDYFDAGSPNLTLRVRVILAVNQPARLGPLLFHCGGPGSIDTCASNALNGLGLDEAYDDFDAFGITQRGMNLPDAGSESTPPTPSTTDSPFLDCPNGTRFTPPYDPKRTYSLTDVRCPLPLWALGYCTAHGSHSVRALVPPCHGQFTTCDCDLPEEDFAGTTPAPMPDVLNETDMLAWLEFAESRNKRCYQSPHWKMRGVNGTTYNFLDYVGTWMLAQDLDTLRAAVGSPKLSIYVRARDTPCHQLP